MPTCPLCEFTQAAGEACDVCGRPFARGEAVPVPVALLEGLEVTRFPPTSGFGTERLADLEPTALHGSVAAPLAEAVEGFSPTALPPVTVAVEPLEVERVGDDAVLEDDGAQPAPLRCRFCLSPADPGQRLCARCGMRLPLERPPPAAGARARPCSDCGVPMVGSQCPACGARR